MEILFEKEVIKHLGLPSIPKKPWNGKDSFQDGVAVVNLSLGRQAYAVCTFNKDEDKEPRIKKVFGVEPFSDIENIFIVPSYMDNDTTDVDLDSESKKKAEQLAAEAKEIENEGVVGDKELEKPKNEYYFDHITNDEEAKAFIRSYNSRNHIKGKIPSTHDGIVMRLAVIFSDTRKASR